MTRSALAEARDKGHRKMTEAKQRAEADDPSFGELAGEFVLQFLRKKGAATGEVMTNAAKRYGITPANDKAFGGVYKGLNQRGLIRCAAILPRIKGNGCVGARLWKLTPKGARANGCS